MCLGPAQNYAVTLWELLEASLVPSPSAGHPVSPQPGLAVSDVSVH